VREHRTAADPLVAEHGGRIVKTTGDGVLIEFGSVVGAVECALALQRLAVERNAGIPGERRMEWRVGIHLGDVLVEGDDISATASTSRHGSKASLSPAASASPRMLFAKYAARSRPSSPTSASRASRTSPGRCASTVPAGLGVRAVNSSATALPLLGQAIDRGAAFRQYERAIPEQEYFV